MNSVHESLFWNQVRVFRRLGIKVLMPKTNELFSYGVNYTYGIHDHPHFQGTVFPVALSDLKDWSHIIAWSGCFEQVNDAIRIGKEFGFPHILYACTNNTAYTKDHGSHLLTEDLITFTNSDVPVRRFVVFPPDYTVFSHCYRNDLRQITTMIREYSSYWPEWSRIYDSIVTERNYSFKFRNYTNLDYTSVPSILRNSLALLHMKSLDGSGNSMMEALASGCPVIVNENLLAGRTCSLFLQPGFNCATIRHHMALEDFDTAIKMIPIIQPNAANSIRQAVREEIALAVVDDMIKQVLK